MQRRFHPALYVILPLAIIGFAYQFEVLLYSLAIPVVIIFLLFGIYMIFQKRSFRRQVNRYVPRYERKKPDKFKTKRKNSVTASFRVIEGRKNRDDDEPPRYH